MVFYKQNKKAHHKKQKKKRVRTEVVGGYAGRAGAFASFAMVLFGIFLGGVASYIGGQSSQVAARYSGFDRITKFEIEGARGARRAILLENGEPLRDGNNDQTSGQQGSGRILRDGVARDNIVQQVLDESDLDDISNDIVIGAGRPQIAIIFDDMGPDRKAFEEILDFQGPLTFSFLPYAKNIQPQVTAARQNGNGVMLHLPMEPIGSQDPGPHALTMSASHQQMLNNLTWNLNQFTDYDGVNNHMGSKFSADEERMSLVLQELKARNLFYLDSVTTPQSAATKAAVTNNIGIIKRDVFLDHDEGQGTVKQQLRQVEKIAKRTGYAVAIAHPHQNTIDVIGPWLASAKLRGFDLITVDSLYDETDREQPGSRIKADLVSF